MEVENSLMSISSYICDCACIHAVFEYLTHVFVYKCVYECAGVSLSWPNAIVVNEHQNYKCSDLHFQSSMKIYSTMGEYLPCLQETDKSRQQRRHLAIQKTS